MLVRAQHSPSCMPMRAARCEDAAGRVPPGRCRRRPCFVVTCAVPVRAPPACRSAVARFHTRTKVTCSVPNVHQSSLLRLHCDPLTWMEQVPNRFPDPPARHPSHGDTVPGSAGETKIESSLTSHPREIGPDIERDKCMDKCEKKAVSCMSIEGSAYCTAPRGPLLDEDACSRHCDDTDRILNSSRRC